MPLWFATATVLGAGALSAFAPADYFPPPDSQSGWRALTDAREVRRATGIDTRKLDEAFEFIKTTSKHGGLLVARKGWLIYERYFGRAHRDATPNTASCGKSFTSIALGILMAERPDLFPDGLEQKVFTPKYFPPEAFPLSDPGRAQINLGQLLAMTAGIRGNNPGYIHGKEVTLDPAGPDGWLSVVDPMALGKMDGARNTITLWCKPGEGYSYASSSPHLASILLRHVTGMELQQFVEQRLARPMGWGRFGWGYRRPELHGVRSAPAELMAHTPGGGGIAPRATDMLRFAYLLQREGRWNDRQLVPAAYIRHSSRRSPYNPHYPYSLQFQLNDDGHVRGVPRDAFWKMGSGGFCFCVVPSLDLVIYRLGGGDGAYDPSDTGLPALPDSVFKYDGSRESWKQPPVDAPIEVRRKLPEIAVERTLEMVVASADVPSPTGKPVWPVPDWQRASSPEEAGMSRAGLERYVAWLRSKAEGEPFGTIIVRSGKIVREYYGSGAGAGSKWEIGSIRKSVTSALLGMAIAEKKLSLDTVVYDVWPEISRITGAEKDKQIRMRHLATNTSGWMTASRPGETWLYNNAACTAGGAVIGRVYGMKEDRIAPLVAERIARKIHAGWDCYHYDQKLSPGSHRQPGPKLAIDSNLRDVARYGYLWLREGEWNGVQIIPREYVREARRNQVAGLGGHYGYWWFTNDGKALLPGAPDDAFFHVGNGKNNRRTVLLVVPSLDLVVVVGTGAGAYDITSGYESQPVGKVDEWICKILEALL
jgi:CubicO group peptidase (beta-lactamase class C family)